MGVHRVLVHIAFAEGKQIGLIELPTDLESEATGFFDRLSCVVSDHVEELVHACGVYLQDDNDIDHEGCDRGDFALTCNHALPYLVSLSSSPSVMKLIPNLILLLACTSLSAQEPAAAPKPETPKIEAPKPAPPQSPAPAPAKVETPKPAAPAPTPAAKPPTEAPQPAVPAKVETPKPAPAAPAKVEAPKPATPPPLVSVFKDKALESAVRRQVFAKKDSEAPLTAEDVANVSIIEGKGLGISDLTGLEKCVGLASLTLTDNKITQLTAIQGLERLQFLDVANNQIRDISPLAACKALQYVELTNNQVVDVSALGSVPALTSLYLAGNQIQDITALFKLPKVWTLYLDGNQVSNLQGIGALKWLSMLSLKGNRVSDLSPLESLTDLQFLFLDKNPVNDFGPLYRMWKKDNDGPREWAPYCQIFIEGTTPDEASKKWIEEIKAAGARITP